MSEQLNFVISSKTTSNYEWVLTKTTKYLRPFVGPKLKKDYVNTNYFNSYTDTVGNIYSVFVNPTITKINFNQESFDDIASKFEYCDTMRGRIDNYCFTIFVNEFPLEFNNDYIKIMKTMYTKTSTEFKKRVLTFYQGNKDALAYINCRLNPTERDLVRKANELDTSIDLIKISGQYESYFSESEIFDEKDFSEGGEIYNYVISGGKF